MAVCGQPYQSGQEVIFVPILWTAANHSSEKTPGIADQSGSQSARRRSLIQPTSGTAGGNPVPTSVVVLGARDRQPATTASGAATRMRSTNAYGQTQLTASLRQRGLVPSFTILRITDSARSAMLAVPSLVAEHPIPLLIVSTHASFFHLFPCAECVCLFRTL